MPARPAFRLGQVRRTAGPVVIPDPDTRSTHAHPAGALAAVVDVLPVRLWVSLSQPRYVCLFQDGSRAPVDQSDLE